MMIEVRVSKKVPASVTTCEPIVMDWLEHIWTERAVIWVGMIERVSSTMLSQPVVLSVAVSKKVPAVLIYPPSNKVESPWQIDRAI